MSTLFTLSTGWISTGRKFAISYAILLAFKSLPLPGLPWSPEFMAAYQEAVAGQPLPIGKGRIRPGTIRALAASYFESLAYRAMKANSQYVRRKIIERFCEETDKDGKKHGDKSAATIQCEHVAKLMAARAAKPESANGLRKALRAMMKHAVESGSARMIPPETLRRSGSSLMDSIAGMMTN